MQRHEYVLAALSAAKQASLTPVQIQKMFFLMDKQVSQATGGPYFDFQPYDYGPFDRSVYDELEKLSREQLAEVIQLGRVREYRLTDRGQELGDGYFAQFPKKAQSYCERVVEFVRSLSFSELVRAIYKAYPEMAANSVFSSRRS